MKKLIIIVAALVVIGSYLQSGNAARRLAGRLGPEPAPEPKDVGSSLTYTFNQAGILEETSNMESSSSPYWWLNSGGRLILEYGEGKTVQGLLAAGNKWRLAYAFSSNADTDGGYHPQNLFRLISRSQWQNVRQEVSFKITALNLSLSPNRNQSNGLFLMSRYHDGNNLYYAGVRVDGAAVIKKKLGGQYHTLAYQPLFGIDYDRTNKPNLLPINDWLNLRSEIINEKDGSVTIKLFIKKENQDWQEVATAHDNSIGGPTITKVGYAGVRTDFIDVVFDNYRLEKI